MIANTQIARRRLDQDESATIDSALNGRKVAIVHYWLVRHRGGERVLEVLAEMFPSADIYTLILDKQSLSPALQNRTIKASFLQKIPGAKRHYQKLMPLYPIALEQFRLDDYDLVISHESGPAKGVLTGARTCHVSYVHSPMRYLWDMYHDYKASSPGGAIGRRLYALTSHYLRLWDHLASSRVDYFAASSTNAARRIRKHYRREVEVIYPPVDLSGFAIGESHGDFYLVVSQLVGYKRIDLAIQACNQLQRPLLVIGDGDQAPCLRAMAGPTVTFLGRQSDEVVRNYYQKCRAFIFPGEEDIGLAPIEAQACGRPVIAFGRGGALETVKGLWPGDPFCLDATGIFFREQTCEQVVEAILRLESLEGEFVPVQARRQAEQFDVGIFKDRMGTFVGECLSEFDKAGV